MIIFLSGGRTVCSYMLVYDEKELINKLMEKAQERIYNNLKRLLKAGAGPVVRFGGAEYATPPLMSNEYFDWLVFQYDSPLMDLCTKLGRKVAVHCHGHIRHALKRFAEMGVTQTDPVEETPDGDINLKEARRITNDRIVLTGYIQMRELYNEDASYIRERVKKIIREAGHDNLIVSTTGTPLEKMTQKLLDNYNAMIDAVKEEGYAGN